MVHGSFERDGWSLVRGRSRDVDELMVWFPDARAVNVWGGPKFRYPFTRESFHEDCHWKDMATFRLNDPDGQFAAFGQLYERHGRINMARLIVHPLMRNAGVGKRLVMLLMDAGRSLFDLDEFSLFVYRDNTPAYQCYKSMGFVVRDYPDNDLLADVCYYLTRPI